MLSKLLPILFFIPMLVISQNKENLSLSLDYSIGSLKMGMVRDYLADTNYFNSYSYLNYPTNTLSKSQSIGFEIGYQPMNFQDFSLGFNYLFCGIRRYPVLMVENPIMPGNTLNFEGEYNLSINATTIVFGSKTYFNKLFHFDGFSSKFMKRLLFATEYKLGFGLSKISLLEFYKNPYPGCITQSFNSYDMNGQINVLFGYKLNEGTLIYAINLKLGYLFYATSSVKDDANNPLDYYTTGNKPKPMNLDFSGLNFGIQLTLRK